MANKDDTTKTLVKAVVKEETEGMKLVMTGVIVAFFIAFILGLIALGAILQSHLVAKQATYQALEDKVNQQSIKTDLLYEELTKSNFNLDQVNIGIIKLKAYFGIK